MKLPDFIYNFFISKPTASNKSMQNPAESMQSSIPQHIYSCSGYLILPSPEQAKTYLLEHAEQHKLTNTIPCKPAVVSQKVLALKPKHHSFRRNNHPADLRLHDIFIRNQSPEFLNKAE